MTASTDISFETLFTHALTALLSNPTTNPSTFTSDTIVNCAAAVADFAHNLLRERRQLASEEAMVMRMFRSIARGGAPVTLVELRAQMPAWDLEPILDRLVAAGRLVPAETGHRSVPAWRPKLVLDDRPPPTRIPNAGGGAPR